MFWRMRSVVFQGACHRGLARLILGSSLTTLGTAGRTPQRVGVSGPARKENVRTWPRRWF